MYVCMYTYIHTYICIYYAYIKQLYIIYTYLCICIHIHLQIALVNTLQMCIRACVVPVLWLKPKPLRAMCCPLPQSLALSSGV